jgi:hypothetical protein
LKACDVAQIFPTRRSRNQAGSAESAISAIVTAVASPDRTASCHVAGALVLRPVPGRGHDGVHDLRDVFRRDAPSRCV